MSVKHDQTRLEETRLRYNGKEGVWGSEYVRNEYQPSSSVRNPGVSFRRSGVNRKLFHQVRVSIVCLVGEEVCEENLCAYH